MPDHDEELARLRERPPNLHLLGGFGPLLVGIVLFLLIVFLAPTVAPEHVVQEPVHPPTSSTLVVTTTTAAATTTVAAP